eukprot:jgi/Mesvir1/25343/Mv14025-RA.1
MSLLAVSPAACVARVQTPHIAVATTACRVKSESAGLHSRRATAKATAAPRWNRLGGDVQKLLVAKPMKSSQPPCFAVKAALGETEIDNAPLPLPPGPWKEIPGGVVAPKGFKAFGMYAKLRARGERPDLSLVVSDTPAVAAGAFTKNVVAAAPVVYSKGVLAKKSTARAVITNAGQANAATGELGMQDTLDTAATLAKALNISSDDVLVESTGVIGRRIKLDELKAAIPKLVSSLSNSADAGRLAADAITTTDLVRKSVAMEMQVGGTTVRLGGMSKGSGMIHPNMATMLGVVTCDASVAPDVWTTIIKTAATNTFNQISVDGDCSTNDCVIGLTNGASGAKTVTSVSSPEGQQLLAGVTAMFQWLAKAIAWDGEGATVLLEVECKGAANQQDANTIAKSVICSSLVKSAIFGRDPNWGRIAAAVGYAGVDFDVNKLDIYLGEYLMMKGGQPVPYDSKLASAYMKAQGDKRGTVNITVTIGDGPGTGKAWGCDLTYEYVTINAEYTT